MARKKHSEFAFIPMNSGNKKAGRTTPSFAISSVHWTARLARKNFTDDDRISWAKLKQNGWRIVKVKITEIA